jgi:drug/metabolite transporter (DMT)-like permease
MFLKLSPIRSSLEYIDFHGSLLKYVQVIIVPFLDGILGAEIPAYTWIGALLSLIGVGILELSGSPPCVGDLLNLLSAFGFAIHMLRTEHISRNMKKENFPALVGCQVCSPFLQFIS